MRYLPQLLHDYLHHSALQFPDKEALVCQGQRLTYAELDRQSNALAHALIRRGVRRGDRVLVFAENTVETVISFWAVLKANAVVSIINPLTKADKLEYVLKNCRAVALITHAQLANTFADAAARTPYLHTVIVAGELNRGRLDGLPGVDSWSETIEAEDGSTAPARQALDIDLAALIYTSGSQGDQKGVMLTHRNMLAAGTSVSTYLEMTDEDVVLCALPLAFDYGLYQMIMTFRVGGRLVLERSFTFPAQVLNVMVQERVTGFPGLPTIYALMSEMKSIKEYDFSAIRYVTNTAAALPVKHIEFLKDLFPTAKIFSMYGLTECKRCTYLPPHDLDRKPLSVGVAIPNTELWIVDDAGNKLGPGEVGELVIRGATVMKGYWEMPEATAKRLRPGPVPGEYVLHTGDLCKLDEEGYLYFVGRMDDIIKSRGEKVAPKEVENALMAIPGVREAAVIGVPDPVLGHAIKAVLVPEAGVVLSEKEVQRACRERLESYMVPKFVTFVDELPKTVTGKTAKRALV